MLTRRAFLQTSFFTGVFLTIPTSVKKVFAQETGISCLGNCLPMCLETNYNQQTSTYTLSQPTGITLNTFTVRETMFIEKLKGLFSK